MKLFSSHCVYTGVITVQVTRHFLSPDSSYSGSCGQKQGVAVSIVPGVGSATTMKVSYSDRCSYNRGGLCGICTTRVKDSGWCVTSFFDGQRSVVQQGCFPASLT